MLRSARESGDLALAEQHLAAWRLAMPQNVMPFIVERQLAQEIGDLDRARQAVKTAQQQFADDPRLKAAQIEQALAEGNFARAKSLLSQQADSEHTSLGLINLLLSYLISNAIGRARLVPLALRRHPDHLPALAQCRGLLRQGEVARLYPQS